MANDLTVIALPANDSGNVTLPWQPAHSPVETFYAPGYGPPASGIPYGNDMRTPIVAIAPIAPTSSFNIADFSISDVTRSLTQGSIFGLPKILVLGVAAYFLFFSKKGRGR